MSDNAVWLPKDIAFPISGDTQERVIGIGYSALEIRLRDDDLMFVKMTLHTCQA